MFDMNQYEALLREWHHWKENAFRETEAHIDALLQEYHESKTAFLSRKAALFQAPLQEFTQSRAAIESENRRTSKGFNVLNYFSLTEPVHSALLADLLNSRGTHGQGRLFLDLFLQRLKMPDYQSGTWVITPEKGRVDILLERKDLQNIILIENKANNAVDQPNQLYRYWYFAIFLSDRGAFPRDHLPEQLPSRYRIIYLVPSGSKLLEAQSLKKPDWLKDPTAPEQIPDQWVRRWSFKDDILALLWAASEQLHPENRRLEEYLTQYVEILSALI